MHEATHAHATTTAHGHGHSGIHPAPTNFFRKYVFSMDHKVIGIQFLFGSLFMALAGGGMAMLMRLQLGWPNARHSLLANSFLLKGGFQDGIMKSDFYNMAVTMHGTIMVFFVIMPLLIGAFGNFLIPLQIGARDMAFPFLNMLSFWTWLPAAVIILWSFKYGAAAAGWTGYAPLSVLEKAMPEAATGQTLWLIGLLLVGTSSIFGALNYITTIINLRAPGMSLMRMPLSIWGLFVTAILLLLATPVLAAALAMALFDRTAGTSFFIPGGLVVNWQQIDGAAPKNGQVLLWQHLFWFFGHPEVYIMILPAMGFNSEIMSVFARKPIFGYKAMVYSVTAIAALGFIVWGHHMFQSGMNPTLGTAFQTATMFIAVPSAVKTFNWLGTIWGGSIRFASPMINALGFISTFVIGGLTGIFLGNLPVDIYFHDTYFVVGHIHYVLFGGALFGGFAAIYYWFPKMFGRMMCEPVAVFHSLWTLVFFNGFAFPMFLLGNMGMHRRIYTWTEYAHLAGAGPLNKMVSVSAFCLGAGQFLLLGNMLYSIFRGKPAGNNPWEANTLEWQTTSPPPHHNFDAIPVVHRGPYDYNHPGASSEFLPQTDDGTGSTNGSNGSTAEQH